MSQPDKEKIMDDFEMDYDTVSCPMCDYTDVPACMHMGGLGNGDYYRCRCCGWVWREDSLTGAYYEDAYEPNAS